MINTCTGKQTDRQIGTDRRTGRQIKKDRVANIHTQTEVNNTIQLISIHTMKDKHPINMAKKKKILTYTYIN